MKWLLAGASLLALTVLASAQTSIKAGSWKITSKTIANGTELPPRVSSRCLTAEQASDVSKTFSPEFGGVNSTCERTAFEAKGTKLNWHLQCKGQLDMDVVAEFTFESPTRYLAIIATKGMMAGQTVVDSKQGIVGEHDGECR